MKRLTTVFFLLFLIVGPYAFAQESQWGIFDDGEWIGAGEQPEDHLFSYDQEKDLYQINMGKTSSESTGYLYQPVKKDFILSGRIDSSENGKYAGLMIRDALDSEASFLSLGIDETGKTILKYRDLRGGMVETNTLSTVPASQFEIEQKEGVFYLRWAQFGQDYEEYKWIPVNSFRGKEAGIFLNSSKKEASKVVFLNPRLTVPFSGTSGEEYPMALHSYLEVLEVSIGSRKVIYSVPYSIQAPNWLNDGHHLIFNSHDGLIYKLDLKTNQIEPIPTGLVDQNNNDHALSFDGTKLGMSSDEEDQGGSVIYTVPIEGGMPQLVTSRAPSYLHGWSPDGKDLVFCGARDGEFDIYKIPSNGEGEEIRLTNAKGLDDGPEYTPDGQYIYFNSVRSGSMQIWRMRPDGSQQEQITFDRNYHNWFPHIAPDGKSLVFISFLQSETTADDHPPYKHVFIRQISIDGGKAKILSYLYGGQGTLNTPCWSPDGKKIAFVSNTEED